MPYPGDVICKQINSLGIASGCLKFGEHDEKSGMAIGDSGTGDRHFGL